MASEPMNASGWVDFDRLKTKRITQPQRLAELFDGHALDCTVLAYSYAMARLPRIPSRYIGRIAARFRAFWRGSFGVGVLTVVNEIWRSWSTT
jgi:hypothetical protein